MHLGLFRLGVLAWENRRGLRWALLLSVTATLALPALLALVIVVALAGPPPLSPAAPGEAPSAPMATWIVTQPFGCTGFLFEPARAGCPHFHQGIDLAAPAGALVVAALPGMAEVLPPSGYDGGYGIHVVIHHGHGLDTMYAHLADVVIASGDEVRAGAPLGHEGSTGMSTGPHLHFEAREGGVAVDPVSMFPGIFGPGGQPR